MQPPWTGKAVTKLYAGNVTLESWLPGTLCEETGSVQSVTISSALPVIPGLVVQIRGTGILPEAKMAVLCEG